MKLQPNKKYGWTEVPLGEKAYEVRELYEPRKDDDLSYIGLEHIEQQTLRLNGIGSSSKTVSTKKAFKRGDILFGSLRPYFRKVVMPKFNGVCSTDIAVIRAKQDTNQAFLFYFVANQAFIDYASTISSGTRMPRATWKIIEKSKWLFPPFPIQHKIASILSAYDDLIENNNRRIKILEEMAQAIYKEWFVNFRFPRHQKVKMVKSELGMIPEGWEVKSISEFGEIITGKTPSKKRPEYYNNNYMPFIKTPDIHDNMFVLQTGEYLSKEGARSQQNKTLPENSICVSCIGTVGIVSITSCHSQTNQQINSIVIKNENSREFLYFALRSLKETIQKYGSTGATMANLNKGKFESLKLICPNAIILNAFHENVESLLDNVRTLLKKNINLRKTRNLLLPKLISGEIDVEKLDIKSINGVTV